jgi:competence protein ComEA
MKRKNPFNDWFIFTKSERRGITVIFALIFILSIFRFLVPVLIKPSDARMQKTMEKVAYLKHITDSLDAVYAQNSIKEEAEGGSYDRKSYVSKSASPRLKSENAAPFDPNTISVDEMVEIGFTERMASNIDKYRSKGGKFFKPADLKRIYGMDSVFFTQLEPYISIEKTERKFVDERPKPTQSARELKAQTIVDINSADTTQFKQLPGIGSVFAKRIVSYRAKLGGFYSVDQVAEVYGLAPETFNAIKPMLQLDATNLKQIDLNFAEFRDLIAHPYLEKEEVNRILNRRKSHGSFKNKTQLLNDSILSANLFKKISPYLKPN